MPARSEPGGEGVEGPEDMDFLSQIASQQLAPKPEVRPVIAPMFSRGPAVGPDLPDSSVFEAERPEDSITDGERESPSPPHEGDRLDRMFTSKPQGKDDPKPFSIREPGKENAERHRNGLVATRSAKEAEDNGLPGPLIRRSVEKEKKIEAPRERREGPAGEEKAQRRKGPETTGFSRQDRAEEEKAKGDKERRKVLNGQREERGTLDHMTGTQSFRDLERSGRGRETERPGGSDESAGPDKDKASGRLGRDGEGQWPGDVQDGRAFRDRAAGKSHDVATVKAIREAETGALVKKAEQDQLPHWVGKQPEEKDRKREERTGKGGPHSPMAGDAGFHAAPADSPAEKRKDEGKESRKETKLKQNKDEIPDIPSIGPEPLEERHKKVDKPRRLVRLFKPRGHQVAGGMNEETLRQPMGPQGGLAASRRGEEKGEDKAGRTIKVNIGRVEVKSPPQPQKRQATPPPAPFAPAISLDAYLERRSRGRI